ncbi:MAG: RnfH family protein [Nitrosospira sp.]|nr:RnfH family protein [Nitrosospira sp.]MDW7643179.1 RnfH family protein [Nitrosomonadaceae bacterium]MBI0414919.1 RnfH family protein [Nitrosospira sp.]MBI0417481.1 RnfH family protein [Nitrosospira sp.]MDW7653197.1 RnfH family protein [Nitrosomonadaceae bacterium]
MNTEIDIEVIYASPLTQTLYQLKVPVGTTAEEAVKISGISEIFPEINLLINKLGIFGRLIDPKITLLDHDRVEVYRPLIANPKERRRKRAEETRVIRKNTT